MRILPLEGDRADLVLQEVTTSQFSRRQAGPAATELPRAPTNLTLKGQIALVSDDED